MSMRAVRTRSSCDAKINNNDSNTDLKTKSNIQWARAHRYFNRERSIPDSSPLLIDPKATIPTTPTMTTMVPYMSVLVTGVPTRMDANRKLKIRDVAPNGATYSARRYRRASVRPMSWERLKHDIVRKADKPDFCGPQLTYTTAFLEAIMVLTSPFGVKPLARHWF